jgi:hypothetical protein
MNKYDLPKGQPTIGPIKDHRNEFNSLNLVINLKIMPNIAPLENMETGDTLLVHGRYFFSAEVIKALLESKRSYVGIVAKTADFGKENEWPPLLLWASNLSKLINVSQMSH